MNFSSRTLGFNRDRAQAFTTGSHAPGYTLTRLDIKIRHTGTMPTYTVRIHEDSSDRPGSALRGGTLDNPTSLPGTAGLVQFTASGTGIVLKPDTTYWVVVDVVTGNNVDTALFATPADGEDTDGATDWTIADTLIWRDN